jgi:hypothetical protein
MIRRLLDRYTEHYATPGAITLPRPSRRHAAE